MAKQLYDYWFVQFDFPDENGRPYKSSGGEMVWNEKLKRKIPASWENKNIEDIADVYNGATPSTINEQNYGGDIVWITPKDLSDQKQKFVYQGERNISQAGYNSCSTHLLPPNTILMSSRAPIGLLSIAKTELCTNQGFKSFVPKAENISTYLYYYLNIHIKQIEQLGTGTTFKEVSREDVLKFPILKPSDAILDLWEKQVSALNNKQFVIQKENEFLTKQRDELLPLLMNGQVSVNNDLLDYVSSSHKDYFNLIMNILETDQAPLDFLAQYYLYGNAQKQVYEHYIEWDEIQSWTNIESWNNNDEKNALIEGWLQYSKEICKEARGWLNNHYEFLTDRFENIGKERCLDLVIDSEFKKLNDKNSELLKQSIDNQAYEINSHNLCIIANFIFNDSQVEEGNLNLSRIRDTKYSIFIEDIENNIDKAVMHFSKDCKDETKDSLLFILNSEKIKTDDKENYLIGQKELLDGDSNIDTDELKTLAYNLFLINPTWKNVISYYKNKDENILIKYIEHFSDNLGNQMIEKDDSEYSSLGAYLLGTTKLTIGTYSSIIKSFEIEFEGYDGLRGLDRDRLLLLLSHNMLPFCEENTNLLKETDIYADYLIKYNKQLLENLSASYISDCEVAYKILSSEVFTYEQKKRIISITPKDILIALDKLANQVLDIIINTDLKNIEEEAIIEVLENASNESYRVYIISLLILEYDYDDNKIAELLSLLGGKYIDIAERSKHPVLEETKWNIKLAGALKHKRFISSAKEDKDGIRIYPKR